MKKALSKLKVSRLITILLRQRAYKVSESDQKPVSESQPRSQSPHQEGELDLIAHEARQRERDR